MARDPVARSTRPPAALGADRGRLLGEIHLPLLGPRSRTAALLVFVEVLKELPATALLRPFGSDTLAHRRLGGDQRVALRDRRVPRAADRRRRARAGHLRGPAGS